jgi:hypothetical protein
MYKNNKISQEKEKLKRQFKPIGLVSGTIGPFVGRIYPLRKNGKIIYQQRFAALPAKYRVNNRKDMVENRNRFKVTNTFAGFVNRIPELKEVWKQYAAKNNHFSAYTAITKLNSAFTTPSIPVEENIIVPPGKTIDSPESNISLLNQTLEIKGLKEGKVIAVVSLFDPKSSKYSKFKLFTLKGELNEDGSGNIILSKELSEALKNYKRYILYFTVVNKNRFINYKSVRGRIKIKKESNNNTVPKVINQIPLLTFPLVIARTDSHSHSPPLAA